MNGSVNGISSFQRMGLEGFPDSIYQRGYSSVETHARHFLQSGRVARLGGSIHGCDFPLRAGSGGQPDAYFRPFDRPLVERDDCDVKRAHCEGASNLSFEKTERTSSLSPFQKLYYANKKTWTKGVPGVSSRRAVQEPELLVGFEAILGALVQASNSGKVDRSVVEESEVKVSESLHQKESVAGFAYNDPLVIIHRGKEVQLDSGVRDVGDRVVVSEKDTHITLGHQVSTIEFLSKTVVWIQPGTSVSIDDGVEYHSAWKVIGVVIQGASKWRLIGGEGVLSLGSGDDPGVLSMITPYDRLCSSIGSVRDLSFTLCSSFSLRDMGIGQGMSFLEYALVVDERTLGDIRVDEFRDLLIDKLRCDRVQCQVTLITRLKLLNDMHRMKDSSDLLTHVVYKDSRDVDRSTIVVSANDFSNFDGIVLACGKSGVFQSVARFNQAKVVTVADSFVLAPEFQLLRVFPYDEVASASYWYDKVLIVAERPQLSHIERFGEGLVMAGFDRYCRKQSSHRSGVVSGIG